VVVETKDKKFKSRNPLKSGHRCNKGVKELGEIYEIVGEVAIPLNRVIVAT